MPTAWSRRRCGLITYLNAAGVEAEGTLRAAYVEPRLYVPPMDPFPCGRFHCIRLDGQSELTFTDN